MCNCLQRTNALHRLVDMSTTPCMEMKVGLLKGTVDEGQWGKSAVLEEEV